MSVDPRRRLSRHELTPENLQTSLQVSNLPAEWAAETVSSIVAGSGIIVKVTPKFDPRTDKLMNVTYDYSNSRECEDAYSLLTNIDKLPCTIEKTIPSDYKTKLKAIEQGQTIDMPEIELNRDSYPWDLGLELPFQMVTNVPIPRRPPVGVSTTTNATVVTPATNMTFPDILSKASKHLPALTPDALSTNDPTGISNNLSKIAPLQLIEMISNLKILANQPTTKYSQIEDFLLNNNKDITIAVSQALLEMGFIDYNVVNSILSGQPVTTNQTTSVPQPQPVPQQIQQAPIPQPQNQPQNQSQTQQAPVQESVSVTPPPQTTRRQINESKLLAAPDNQREMIRQVLTLTDAQLEQLPTAQRSMVEGLRKEYLV
ncbi:similar to Saccharomyces cerevisiae YGR156W PTI1 Essential protein that is a component of CPF (cleavage and polyadenylation factor) [Maudiozyma barnettii]|uniref:Similar to Saccharomyces cerevisiae YGR156W PTI1 Essential protein that is a component of CPF (Cleavage and polyadenylation factor) n=1 Tax=Maudiozyma barnettii TaxID=61262 RepID=A0A8H2VH54_9SACH|nr:cleavage polyadenylation factor subunit PTI1 [Kazachstania barnettii]CAB4255104.1 similar to Saccharomyces cerevisiae YGR156W PTI1 Essential protein that is a component of CPF (cleavage and polyadenylation factor) [Kazachstania barnettii]CAD1783375.1 similar to Saccharomyces cerevisiae YGR156W PTI1 Essential protein that is a component of CPF (cleavage and polyadenylation factor) [Kazachstania barnettii]